MSAGEQSSVVDELIARSNRLGADRRNTNYGGGNTSAKGQLTDPASGDEVEVMWVKGSGGDLGTLTADGLSVLRLDGIRRLGDVYRGEEHEDEMHQRLDFCIFGPPGAAPSIDTSMHGLLEVTHVDHLHPDSVIALAASADGEELTKRCYGDEVGWVPWRRPGFQLALDMEDLRTQRPDLKGVVMGGHGLTAWGDSSEACESNSFDLIARATEFIERHGRSEPLGPIRPGFEPLGPSERDAQAAALAPVIRGLAGTDGPVVGRWFD
ncbi:MAG: class II aldolase/adducin family protein, partial [Acidimicrobiia bacterium]